MACPGIEKLDRPVNAATGYHAIITWSGRQRGDHAGLGPTAVDRFDRGRCSVAAEIPENDSTVRMTSHELI